MNLTNTVAVVTGGKRIGRVVARALAERGADLVLTYRGSKREAEETAQDVVAGRDAGPRSSRPTSRRSKAVRPSPRTPLRRSAVSTSS